MPKDLMAPEVRAFYEAAIKDAIQKDAEALAAMPPEERAVREVLNQIWAQQSAEIDRCFIENLLYGRNHLPGRLV